MRISFWCDWLQWPWSKYNWVNLRLIGFDIEWDKLGDEIVVEIGLLGFNLRIQQFLGGRTEQYKELIRRVKDFKKEEKEK